MKTQAAILWEINQPLKVETIDIPEPEPGQVLVEIHYSGICRSQVNEISGAKGEDRFLPHTLGHEGSGVVLKIGPRVNKVRVGDHVVLTWIKGGGADVPSSAYATTSGVTINSGAISTFMRHALVSENRVVPIAAGVALNTAALLGCAVPTGAGMLINAVKKHPVGSVAVFGAGGIGLCAIAAARSQGIPLIIGIDIADNKLAVAKQAGATHLINLQNSNALLELRQLTQGLGVDLALEAAGKKESMEAAFASVRPHGGRCILAGNLAAGQQICIDPFGLIQGKEIVGTWGGETKPDADIPVYADWCKSGKLQLDVLLNNHYPLTSVNDAIADLQAGRVSRALLEMKL